MFLYFELFLAKTAFLVLKKLRIHYLRSDIFVLKIDQYTRYQRIRIFTLVSKMLTYLSDKVHPKKIITKKQILCLKKWQSP
jgi:hypothetical protein